MRLSDAALCRRRTKLIYPHHRSTLGSPKTPPRDRSNRLLDCATKAHGSRHLGVMSPWIGSEGYSVIRRLSLYYRASRDVLLLAFTELPCPKTSPQIRSS